MASSLAYCFLLLSAVLTLSVARSASFSDYPSVASPASSGLLPFDVRAWIELLNHKIKIHSPVDVEESPKRSCSGFPCMYTHLGAKAGRQAMMRSLMSIIHNCAHDPMCSPGKRRRRSAGNVLSLLKQRRNLS